MKLLVLLVALALKGVYSQTDPLFASACNGNGDEFLVFNTRRGYSGSRTLCTRNNAIIARIDTIEDFNLVSALTDPLGDHVWVGLRDQVSNDDSGTDRFFYEDLVDDNRAFFDVGGKGIFPWLADQPSNTCSGLGCTPQNCVEHRKPENLWNDNNCDVANFYVCRRPCNTNSPTPGPTAPTTAAPTKSPTTSAPTVSPTTSAPTLSPISDVPTVSPTNSPTDRPTVSPTDAPTVEPTVAPTKTPTESPTTSVPTVSPTDAPTDSPTVSPTKNPTGSPTQSPTDSPTQSPTKSPTASPTEAPTLTPTSSPTKNPTRTPTKAPTGVPTTTPTKNPTVSPTISPTDAPTVTDNSDFFAGLSLLEVIYAGAGIGAVTLLLFIMIIVISSRSRKRSRRRQSTLSRLGRRDELVNEQIENGEFAEVKEEEDKFEYQQFPPGLYSPPTTPVEDSAGAAAVGNDSTDF